MLVSFSWRKWLIPLFHKCLAWSCLQIVASGFPCSIISLEWLQNVAICRVASPREALGLRSFKAMFVTWSISRCPLNRQCLSPPLRLSAKKLKQKRGTLQALLQCCGIWLSLRWRLRCVFNVGFPNCVMFTMDYHGNFAIQLVESAVFQQQSRVCRFQTSKQEQKWPRHWVEGAWIQFWTNFSSNGSNI